MQLIIVYDNKTSWTPVVSLFRGGEAWIKPEAGPFDEGLRWLVYLDPTENDSYLSQSKICKHKEMKSEPLEDLHLPDYSEISMCVRIDHICKLSRGDVDETFDYM